MGTGEGGVWNLAAIGWPAAWGYKKSFHDLLGSNSPNPTKKTSPNFCWVIFAGEWFSFERFSAIVLHIPQGASPLKVFCTATATEASLEYSINIPAQAIPWKTAQCPPPKANTARTVKINPSRRNTCQKKRSSFPKSNQNVVHRRKQTPESWKI